MFVPKALHATPTTILSGNALYRYRNPIPRHDISPFRWVRMRPRVPIGPIKMKLHSPITPIVKGSEDDKTVAKFTGAVELMMNFWDKKEEEEVKAEIEATKMALSKDKCIQFIVDAILLILTSNPLLRCLTKSISAKDKVTMISHDVAFWGTWPALRECIDFIMYKYPPNLEIVGIGYAIFKTTMWNYSLYKTGKKPIWTPLIVALHLGKIFLDVMYARSAWSMDEYLWGAIFVISSSVLAYTYVKVMSQCEIQQNSELKS